MLILKLIAFLYNCLLKTNMNIVIIGTENVGEALAQAIIKGLRTVLVGAGFSLSEKSLKLEAIIGEDKYALLKNTIIQLEVICF
jgi:predicted dinucleotide-binding enzyme